MKFYLGLALSFFAFTPLFSQQSLFDKAVRLDSLYDRLLAGETDLADDIFAELRDLYPSGQDLTDRAIHQDVSGDNFYLAPKMNYVHNHLLDIRRETRASTDELDELRDSLIYAAIEAAEAACPEQDPGAPDACPFADELLELSLWGKAEEIAAVRAALGDDYPELDAALRRIELEIFDVDIALDQLEKEKTAALSLEGGSGPGEFLTGGGGAAGQGFAPIVVQSAGGGSVQGAVIDGASRWIAERMREELSIAFFDRFEIWLEEQNMTTLFPSTVKALGITATTDYSLMIQVLRSAFERDLEELPFNIAPFLRTELGQRTDITAVEAAANVNYAAWRKAESHWYNLPNDASDRAYEVARERADSLGSALYYQQKQLTAVNQEFNYVMLSITAIHELSRGRHVAGLLGVLNERADELFPHGGNIRPALMIMDVLSRSFISVDPERGTTWLRRKDLNRLTRDQQLREFYFGLIYHELRRMNRRRRNALLDRRAQLVGKLGYYGDTERQGDPAGAAPAVFRALDRPEVANIERKLKQLEDEWRFIGKVVLAEKRWTTRESGEPWIGSLLNELSVFTERMDNLQRQYTALRASDQASLGNPQLIQLIRGSVGVLRPVLEIALPDDDGKVATIMDLSEGILDAYTGVLEKDYDAVVLSVIPVAGKLLDVDYAETLLRGELPEAEVATFTANHAVRKRKLQEIFRYGAFLAAVAQSRSPEDIKQAIRAIALPPGSYSIKRRSFANISLNTYPGLTGGMELIQNDLGREWAPNFGFTAPGGLAFSWGYRARINNEKYLGNPKYRRRVDRSLDMRNDRYLNGHSGSVFFSLIDLGAVVLFRLDDSDSSLPEDVGFQQVFSPGVMYAHGFPQLPISVLAGVQVSPELRKFGDDPADSFRFNLGVTVDLPMANFHTRSVEREE